MLSILNSQEQGPTCAILKCRCWKYYRVELTITTQRHVRASKAQCVNFETTKTRALPAPSWNVHVGSITELSSLSPHKDTEERVMVHIISKEKGQKGKSLQGILFYQLFLCVCKEQCCWDSTCPPHARLNQAHSSVFCSVENKWLKHKHPSFILPPVYSSPHIVIDRYF